MARQHLTDYRAQTNEPFYLPREGGNLRENRGSYQFSPAGTPELHTYPN